MNTLVDPTTTATLIAALAETYRRQRRDTLDLAKLYYDLRSEGMKLAEINATLIAEHQVSPADESTISRYVTTYDFWVIGRRLSVEAWTRIGYSKLLMLAKANVAPDSQEYWLAQAFQLGSRELQDLLRGDGQGGGSGEWVRLSLSEAPAHLWEQARDRLRETIPEFDVPGVMLSDDSMVEFMATIVIETDAELLRSLYRKMHGEDEPEPVMAGVAAMDLFDDD